MNKKYGYFRFIKYEDGKRFVFDQDYFYSICIQRTPFSNVVNVQYITTFNTVKNFQVHLDEHSHLEVHGV